jgi:hypothetical protein
LDVAKNLDPGDPTPWLYSALAKHDEYRNNEAVRDLEQSIDLNSNRAVYRSDPLLDQDRAVRGANLAGIYRDVGLVDVSLREASRSLNYDYANGSAHLFLANSYDALRDPQQFNLRYETPWLNELLLANLLQPVGAGSLSQTISHQEYSRLFERDHAGVYSLTEYASRGDWVENGSVYLTDGPLGASFDASYLSQNGYRPNQDQQNLALWTKLKYQITPNDSVLLQALYADIESGDRPALRPGLARTTPGFTRLKTPSSSRAIITIGARARYAFPLSWLDNTRLKPRRSHQYTRLL